MPWKCSTVQNPPMEKVLHKHWSRTSEKKKSFYWSASVPDCRVVAQPMWVQRQTCLCMPAGCRRANYFRRIRHADPHIHRMASLPGQQSSDRNSPRAHKQWTSVNSLEDPLGLCSIRGVEEKDAQKGRGGGGEERERVKNCSWYSLHGCRCSPLGLSACTNKPSQGLCSNGNQTCPRTKPPPPPSIPPLGVRPKLHQRTLQLKDILQLS